MDRVLINCVYVGHLSTVKKETDQDSRIPAENAETRRPQGSYQATGQGSEAADSIFLTMQRAFRLPRGKDLDLLFRRGRRLSTPLFQIASRRNNLSHARFLLVVPRTVDKRAVVRNRLRRRITEYIRIRPALFSPPLDIAIVCKKEAVRATHTEFYEVLDRVLTQIFRDQR